MLKNTINHLLEKKTKPVITEHPKNLHKLSKIKKPKKYILIALCIEIQKSEKLLSKKKMHKSNKIRACF